MSTPDAAPVEVEGGRPEVERRFCHTVQLPDEDRGECEWDECPLLTEGCCALPMPPRTKAITPEDLAALDRLIVGSMCHCDEPDECHDHWQFFIVDDPATAMYDGEHVGQGRTLNEAQMRYLAALSAAPATPDIADERVRRLVAEWRAEADENEEACRSEYVTRQLRECADRLEREIR